MNLFTAACAPLETRRTPKLIRQSDPGMYVLAVSLRGTVGVLQEQRETAVGAGDLVLYDTSRPFRIRTGLGGTQSRVSAVIFPHALLPLHPDRVRRLLAVRLPGHAGTGVGALVARFVADLARQPAAYPAASAVHLATATTDLLAALLADALADRAALPPETHSRTLLLHIQAFIQQHLDDPALSPDTIAAAHHISTRYLHKLFQAQGMTVGGWIRDRRLDRCRRDLADPALASWSIGEIAARWGLRSGAHFSRVFRGAYGLPPSDYRQLHREPLPSTEDVRGSSTVVR